MKKNLGNESGFTLIEIIISIGILSIVSVIILRLFVVSHTLNEELKVSDIAGVTAMNIIEEIKLYDSVDNLIEREKWLEKDSVTIAGTKRYDNTFTSHNPDGKYILYCTMKNSEIYDGLYTLSIDIIDSTTNEGIVSYETNHYFKRERE